MSDNVFLSSAAVTVLAVAGRAPLEAGSIS